MSRILLVALLIAPWMTSSASAQSSPPSEQTPNVQSKPGATIIINPTHEECALGWNSSLKWSKEQFDDFCHKLNTSK